MIVEIRLGIVVAAEGAHDKDTALAPVVVQNQVSVLEHLKAQGWRSSVQGNHIDRPCQSFFEQCADLQRVGEHIFGRHGGWKQNATSTSLREWSVPRAVDPNR